MTPRIGLVAVALLVTSAACAIPPSADLVLLNGKIITVDAGDSVAEALAVRDGRILKVGTSAEIGKLAGPKTRVIDLKGRAATPGLIDSHAHIIEGGDDPSDPRQIDLSDTTSVADIVERVRARAAKSVPGAWVMGAGWDEGKLKERRYVTAADLDPVSAGHPVWLEHTTGHYGTGNSAALRLAGITAATPDPKAGTIDRDADGRVTGVLKEGAKDIVTALLPAPTQAELERVVRYMVGALHKEGMTAFKDPDDSVEDFAAYRALAEAGKLDAHVCVLLHGGDTLESVRAAIAELAKFPRPPASIGDRLMACGIKLFLDGSGAARTAWMNSPWYKNGNQLDTGNVGYPLIAPEVYREQIRLITEAGLNVGTHAVGDRAIDWAVDTYASVLATRPVHGLRHTIIHANLTTPGSIATMARLERDYDAGYPEAQAPFLWWIGDNYAGNIGPARAPHLIPLASFLKAGVHWGGGSDYPVTPFAARYGLWAAGARETLNGRYGKQPFGTAESVDIHAALRAYTAANAHLLFLERRIGSLEVGKDADIAIWDRDLYSVPLASLKELRCQLTLLAGRIVFRAADGPEERRARD
jgi:predicted amidohydrolase YtcJ